MADLANLVIAVDSTQVAAGGASLDKLAASGKRAEASMDSLGATATRAGSQTQSATAAAAAEVNRLAAAAAELRGRIDPMYAAQQRFDQELRIADDLLKAGVISTREYAQAQTLATQALQRHASIVAGAREGMDSAANAQRAIGGAARDAATESERAAGGIGKVGASSGLAAHHAQNLVFQLQDIFVGLSSGQKPLTVFIQQGTQIAGIMGQAGLGVKGLVKELGGMAAGLVGVVASNPLVWALAAAAGAAAISFYDFKKSVDDSGEIKRFVAGLGLTEKELKKLPDQTITWGDALLGTWDVINEGLHITELLGKAWDVTIAFIKDVLTGFGEAFLRLTANLVGVFTGAFEAIKATWALLPAAIGDATLQAANYAITGINMLVEKSVGIINTMIDGVNQTFGLSLGHLSAAQIDPLANPFAGSMEKVGKAGREGFAKGFDAGYGGVMAAPGRLGDAIADATMARAKKRLKSAADDLIDKRSDGGAHKKNADGLAKEAAAAEAAISGMLKLAAAYLESDAAAMRAEASAKATEAAIRKGGDTAIFIERELRKMVAQRLVDGAKTYADLRANAAAQNEVNRMVEDGTITTAQANQAMQEQLAMRPLLAAYENADADTKKKLTVVMKALAQARKDDNDAKAHARFLDETSKIQDSIALLEKEKDLIGATARERAIALAGLKAEQEAKAANMNGVDTLSLIAVRQGEAAATVDLAEAQKQFNGELRVTSELATAAASQLSTAFGDVGSSIGALLSILGSYGEKQAEIAQQERDGAITAAQAHAKGASLRIASLGALTSAAKGLFKEHSKGYQAMVIAEKVLAALQLANTIKSIAMDATKTASSVANSTTRATADTAAGAAKMFGETGPGGFALVPAMIAMLAGLGLAVAGGGGGGGAVREINSLPNAEQMQARQGTGTVLGDIAAQSKSLSNSLALMVDNTNKQLEYQNDMVRSLRAIETNIGSLTAAIGRQFQVSGFGLFSSMGVDEIKLSKNSTASLTNSGVSFHADTLGNIMANGIQGAVFETVKVATKKFSISFDVYNAMDQGIKDQATKVLTSMYQTILLGTAKLGVTGLEGALKATQIALGKISLQGLSGSAVTDALNAVFSAAADTMVANVLPSIIPLQKAGEGLYETLMRLVKQYQAIDVELKSIGKTFGAVGLESAGARQALIDLFGSLDDFISQTDFYKENFLTAAQQMAPVMAAVNDEMARLGLASVDSIAAFKSVVDSLDLSSAAGQSLFASLMAVAPAFAAVEKYQTDQASKAKDTLTKAYQTQRDELDATAKKFKGFSATLHEFLDSLTSAENGTLSYNQALTKLMTVGALAATGDATALGSLSSVGRDFLTIARNNSSSLAQYQSAIALVSGYVNDSINAADRVATSADQQIAVLDQSLSALGSIDLTLTQIETLLSGGTVIATGGASPATITVTAQDGASYVDLLAEVKGLRADIRAIGEPIAANMGSLARRVERWDDNGAVAVTTRDGDTVTTKAV